MAMAIGSANSAANPTRNAVSAMAGEGTMNATGNATAATDATPMSHLSWWRSTEPPRRYRIATAATAAPEPDDRGPVRVLVECGRERLQRRERQTDCPWRSRPGGPA